jgi:hypothetical protein
VERAASGRRMGGAAAYTRSQCSQCPTDQWRQKITAEWHWKSRAVNPALSTFNQQPSSRRHGESPARGLLHVRSSGGKEGLRLSSIRPTAAQLDAARAS